MYENFNDLDMLTKDIEEVNEEISSMIEAQDEILDYFKNIKGFITGEILPEMQKIAMMSSSSTNNNTGRVMVDETTGQITARDVDLTNWNMNE